MAMKENSKKIFMYVKENEDSNITLADISEAVGLPVKSVNGSIVAFQRKEWMERIPATVEITDEEGNATMSLQAVSIFLK